MSIIKRLSGLSQIYSNDIIATGNVDSTQDISGYTIVGNPSSYFLSISSNIQTQINSLQNAISGVTLTISGNTISGVVLLSYLTTYYYTIQDIKDINTNAYIAMIDTFDNYYTKSSINSLSKSLSDNILSISDSLVITNNNVTSISSFIYNTISSNINNNSLNITSISSFIYNTISSNINNNSLNITSVSSYIYNTISNNIYNNSLNITSVSSYIFNTISSQINNNVLNITSVSSYIYNTISPQINNNILNITSISNKLAPITISTSGDITTSGNIICNNFLGIPKSYFSNIDYSNTLQNILDSKTGDGLASTAKSIADDCHYQIYEQGSSITLLGIVISFTPPSPLNQRIIDAQNTADNAKSIANDAKSSASSANTAIGIMAGFLGFDSIATLLTAGATAGLAGVVAGLSTTVGGHTINLTLLNTKTQYISTDIEISNNFTIITSDVKISPYLSPNTPCVFFSQSFDGNSFFNNTVKFYKDITCDGLIKFNNTDLNSYLVSVSGNVSSISGKIKYIKNVFDSTIINSALYIQDISNVAISKLVNDYSGLSYIGTNLTVSGNLQIDKTIINTELTNKLNTISGNLNTISGKVNTASTLNYGITVTQNMLGGYDVNIGTAFSNVYINGSLYYNNVTLFRNQNVRQNAVDFLEYINQI